MQKKICLYLHVHQPFRLTKLNYLKLGEVNDYFLGTGEMSNQAVLAKISEKSYLPTNRLLLNALKNFKDFHISLSITGTIIEQFQKYAPETLKSFQKLTDTGKVEILSETYYHSLASEFSLEEFCEQIWLHRNLIKSVFDYDTKSFRNTELIYNNKIASIIKELGFGAIIAEGWDPLLNGNEPNHLFAPKFDDLNDEELQTIKQYKFDSSDTKLLLKNYKLSDDIAFRFSNQDWEEYPLSVENYLNWVDQAPGEIINLFMDYETFGEHQWQDTGIFEFLAEFIEQALAKGYEFTTIADAAASMSIHDNYSVPESISWADIERDLSAWTGNKLQDFAIQKVYELGKDIQRTQNKARTAQSEIFMDQWRKLQTSDHFYYMSTKYWNDGDVHKYFSPYDSPYEAFINYMNILEDFRQKLQYER